ncbi:MAG: terpene cyclase/mutase family protein [Planctomycetes bacterium]|nr:terpene cyclase/mutase family protein [Planctomycetota bacterium]
MRVAAALVLCAMAQEGEVYVYKQTDLSTGKPCDERLVVLSCELKNGIACRSPRDIPIVLLFTLPGKQVAKGQSWEYERDFFVTQALGGTALVVPRVRVIGKFTVTEIKESVAEIAGTFSVFEGQERNGEWIPARKAVAAIETQQAVDGRKSLLETGTYGLTGAMRENASVPLGIHVRTSQVKVVRRIERAEKETSVEEAIKKGREWLAKQQQPDGRFPGWAGGYWVVTPVIGSTAMGIMALMHSGMRADDPVIRRAWEFVRAKSATMPREVYDVSLALLALEARYSAGEKSITPEDKGVADKWAAWLVDSQLKPVVPDDGTPSWNAAYLDLANTQYAVMGLQAARRCGYKVPASAWRFILRRFARVPYGGEKAVELALEGRELGVEKGADGWKAEPGSWGYFTLRVRGPGYKEFTGNSPLTCAALAIVKICESELKAMGELDDADRRRAHDALRQGFAWLQTHWSVRAALPEAGSWSVWHLYYLWSLERAATLAGVQKIGGHDWYKEGEAYLLATQHPDGSWNSPADVPTVDTAFALLFLRRPGTATKGDK